MPNTTNTTPSITQQWERGTLTPTHTHHLSHCVRRLDKSTIPHLSNDTYSHIHHDTITGRGASKKSREDTVAEDVEMGGYSMVSYGDKSQEQDVGAYSGSEVGEKQGKKRKKDNKKASADSTVNQLYAQVDKKKKKDGDSTQLYAQVDKKRDGETHLPEAAMQVDQLYAQVDKKNSREKEVCEDSPQESGAVYSVVSKPHPPQVPEKSNLLMDDLYNWRKHTCSNNFL